MNFIHNFYVFHVFPPPICTGTKHKKEHSIMVSTSVYLILPSGEKGGEEKFQPCFGHKSYLRRRNPQVNKLKKLAIALFALLLVGAMMGILTGANTADKQIKELQADHLFADTQGTIVLK